MKRLCTTLLWGLAVVSLATAQPSFFKAYLADSLFVWAGLASGNDGTSMVALATDFDAAIVFKLAADGTMIWGKAFQGLDENNNFYIIGDIITASDGSIVAIASQDNNSTGLTSSVIIRLSAEGNLLWSYRIPNVVSWLDYELDIEGDDILVCTSTGRNGFYLARLSLQGQVQWAKQYRIPGYEDYFSCGAVFAPNAKVLLRGNIARERGSDFGYSARMEIDAATGTAIRASFTEDHYTNSIAFDEQGNRYESFHSLIGNAFGSPRYAKYNLDGQPVWCKQLNGLLDINLLGRQFQIGAGYLDFFVSYVTRKESYGFRLAQSDGSVIWSKVYQGAHYVPLGSNPGFILRPDNGIAWLGTNSSPAGMAIVQVDMQGEVEGCVTYSPCNISLEDAPFPEFTAVSWTEEDYPAYEPITLLESSFIIRDSQYCAEPWFSADFTAASPVCTGDTIQVRQQETSLEVTSEWSFEGGIPAGSTQPADTVRYDMPGSYALRHIAGAFGCRDTAYAEVVVQESPDFTLGPDTSVCPGATLLLGSGLEPEQYALEWQDGSTSSTFEAAEPGVYTLTAAGDAGCTRTDTFLLSFYSLPVVELGPDTTLCGGSSLEIAPYTDAAQPIYRWNTTAVSPRLLASAPGLYSLTVTDAATGCAEQDSVQVTFAPPLLLRQLPDTSVCPGQLILLEIQSLGGSRLPVQWEGGATDNPYAIAEHGTYGVRVYDGACDTLLNILVSPGDCRPGIFLPNAFSPNGDGQNDFFQPFGPDMELGHLQVFSRWGALLYEGRGADARWDGAAFGKPAPAGIYVYKAEYRLLPGEERKVAAGEVTLLR